MSIGRRIFCMILFKMWTCNQKIDLLYRGRTAAEIRERNKGISKRYVTQKEQEKTRSDRDEENERRRKGIEFQESQEEIWAEQKTTKVIFATVANRTTTKWIKIDLLGKTLNDQGYFIDTVYEMTAEEVASIDDNTLDVLTLKQNIKSLVDRHLLKNTSKVVFTQW